VNRTINNSAQAVHSESQEDLPTCAFEQVICHDPLPFKVVETQDGEPLVQHTLGRARPRQVSRRRDAHHGRHDKRCTRAHNDAHSASAVCPGWIAKGSLMLSELRERGLFRLLARLADEPALAQAEGDLRRAALAG
jgi:hypothetical protein